MAETIRERFLGCERVFVADEVPVVTYHCEIAGEIVALYQLGDRTWTCGGFGPYSGFGFDPWAALRDLETKLEPAACALACLVCPGGCGEPRSKCSGYCSSSYDE